MRADTTRDRDVLVRAGHREDGHRENGHRQIGHREAVAGSAERFAQWRGRVRAESMSAVEEFVAQRCREHLGGLPDTDVLEQVLCDFVRRGKYIRSTFVLAGWSCVAPQTPAAVRAAASMELLHCFALLQDDVMDASALRRGAPAAHVVFADWHRRQGLAGEADRFGESAAVLAGDLCLVWADQMLRESGLQHSVLARALPRYDQLRSELAVGQFRDIVNDARRQPSLHAVRQVAQAKSGNYTVRRPIELGADLAGAPPRLLGDLGRYGAAVGEAFQLRDDLLGLFGSPEVTGKPAGEDVRERKATCVVVLAREHATPGARRELARLDALPRLAPGDVRRYLEIIEETGAREHTERLIEERVSAALAAVADAGIPAEAYERLEHLARLCTNRVR